MEPTNWLIRSLYHDGPDFLAWWRPNGGYTSELDSAGRFTREEAERRCASAPERNVVVREEDAFAAAVRVVRSPSSLGKVG